MSDDAANTPPRKVGSLRDRIAQFESKPAAAAPAPPPKPSGAKKTWAWKEKQAETPPPPVAAPSTTAPAATSAASSSSALIPESEHRDDHEEQAAHGGMSAEDAKNAISQGGGLKARLAALQGSGFGAPVDASPVPPPSSGKPRVWKKAIVHHEPTPKPQHVLSEDDEEHDVPPAHDEEAHAEPDVPQTAEADSADEPQDDAAEERQRRAAIAARMARLGGARVGMPVVFGKGPAPPPPKRNSDDSGSAVVSPPVPSKKLSIDDASSLRPESASEVTDTDLTQEETEYPETSTEDDRSIMPSSSPPRVRPPIPAARAWSPSPPASPKPMSRPEIISQEGEAVEEVKGCGSGAGEDEVKEVDEQKIVEKENTEEGGQPEAAAVPLPPSRKPTAALSTSPTPTSPSPSMPLPAMPKRAAPPRRKMPTPKPSSDSVPKVTSPPVEAVPDSETTSKAASLDVPAPPTEDAPTPAPSLSPEPKVTVVEALEPEQPADNQALPEVEPVASPPADEVVQGLGHQREIEEETKEVGGVPEAQKEFEDVKEDSRHDEKESEKELKKATGGDFEPRSPPTRKLSETASGRKSLSRPPPTPRAFHEASPREILPDRSIVLEPLPTEAEGLATVDEPEAIEEDEATLERERKSRLAERMAKVGGVGMFGGSQQRPTPARKPSKPTPPSPSMSQHREGSPAPVRTFGHQRTPSQGSQRSARAVPSASSTLETVEAEVLVSPAPKRSLPPTKRSLPPLPITTDTPAPPPSASLPRVPLSARPGRTSMPPGRLPPPPPTAPIQGSFADKQKASIASEQTRARRQDSIPQTVVVPEEYDGANSLLLVPPSPRARDAMFDDESRDQQRQIGQLMVDMDTDPIDPTFYSPLRSPLKLPLELDEEYASEPDPEPEPEPEQSVVIVHDVLPIPQEESPEASRKKTLAERMAKLGGISLSAPGSLPQPGRRPQQTPRVMEQTEASASDQVPETAEEEEEETADAARTRRAAIAARLAAGGGMRLGMLPGRQPPLPSPAQVEPVTVEEPVEIVVDDVQDEDEVTAAEPTPPAPSQRAPVPPAIDTTRPPPLPPGRHSRPNSALPPTPGFKSPMSPPSRIIRTAPQPPAESMIGEEQDEVARPLPALPPPSPPHEERRPTVTYEPAPPPPPPPPPGSWGLPEIPSSSLAYDQSPSERYEPVEAQRQEPRPPEVAAGPPSSQSRQPLDVAGLTALWQRVGLSVVGAAKILVEQSKHSIIADGTPGGFVETALAAVPSAQPIFPDQGYFGCLIYHQSGPTIMKRSADIMPGDIVALTDVKLKGFKGLQSYNLHIGTSGGPLLAICQDFEGGKKQKLRVFQAALQSNTYPSIESTSYRLDDLKSGSVQVFRVEEAFE